MSTAAGGPSTTPALACGGTGFPVGPSPDSTANAASGSAGAGTIGREPTGPLLSLPDASCSNRAPAPPTGFPRVLTVPLPCASSRALALRASVSRETAADSACFTRAGGPSGSPWKTCPCPSSPALLEPGAGPAVRCPDPATTALAPGTGRPVPDLRRGQPSPAGTSLDSSQVAPKERPRGSSGHPTPSGEAISALLPGAVLRRSLRLVPQRGPVPGPAQASPGPVARPAPGPAHPGQLRVWSPRSATVIGAQSAGPLLQPDRPYRSRQREPPRPADPAG